MSAIPEQRVKLPWTPKLFGPDDYPGVARLMSDVYGADHRSADHRFLRWQYEENPLGRVIGFLALSPAGETVAAYTLLPHPFLVGGRPLLGALSLNTATSQRYQGQGIFTKLAVLSYTEAERRGVVGVLGFPNENSLPGFVKKLGFALVGRLRAWVRPRKPGIVLARAKTPTPLHHLLDSVTAPLFGLASHRGVVRPVDAAIVPRLPRSPVFALEPREDWVDWRFARSPLWPYETVWSKRSEAAVICRHDTLWGVRTTLLLDFAANFGAPGALRSLVLALLSACRRAAEEDSAQVMTIVSPHHPAVPALALAGFIPVPDRFLPHPAHVIYRPLGGHPTPGALNEWAISVGAYDAG